MSAQIVSALGLAGFAALAWAWGALATRRAAVPWRMIATGLALQIAVAAALLAIPPLRRAIGSIGHAVDALQRATEAGTSLVFGYLGGGANLGPAMTFGFIAGRDLAEGQSRPQGRQ